MVPRCHGALRFLVSWAMTPARHPTTPKQSTIWSVSHIKGGCGKTVTSIQMAALLASLGRKVVLGDFDRRGGAVTKFIGRRAKAMNEFGADVVPEIIDMEISSEEHLIEQIGRCRKLGWDMVLDTHPAQANSLAYALTYCDIAIVPVRQGHTEMESWGQVIDLLRLMEGVRRQYKMKPLIARSLITDFRPTRRGRMMKQQMFFSRELIYLGEVPHSEVFGDAILEGMTIWEYRNNHKHARIVREVISDAIQR